MYTMPEQFRFAGAEHRLDCLYLQHQIHRAKRRYMYGRRLQRGTVFSPSQRGNRLCRLAATGLSDMPVQLYFTDAEHIQSGLYL